MFECRSFVLECAQDARASPSMSDRFASFSCYVPQKAFWTNFWRSRRCSSASSKLHRKGNHFLSTLPLVAGPSPSLVYVYPLQHPRLALQSRKMHGTARTPQTTSCLVGRVCLWASGQAERQLCKKLVNGRFCRTSSVARAFCSAGNHSGEGAPCCRVGMKDNCRVLTDFLLRMYLVIVVVVVNVPQTSRLGVF